MTTLTTSRPTSVVAVAAATPAGRERYVDFLRVFSLAVVMFGHWIMAAVEWRDGRLVTGNVLEAAPAAQWLKWVFQIMPVFFIVGGFSNTASWTAAVRDGRGYGDWLGSRLVRLVRPVLAFALVWSAVVAALTLAGIDPASVRARSIAQPLWFLAVYVLVVAAAPVMVAAHRRWAWGVPVALASAVALVDLARWPLGVPLVGWANLALVWLFAHQLGVAWRDGAVRTWSRRRMVGLAVVGLGGLLLLTGAGGYPHSMVGGVSDEARSNTLPPSLALVALGVWQFAATLLLRPAVDRWLDRPRAWSAVVAANGMAMTVFLWHLTALVIVAAVALPAGWMPQPPVASGEWWAWRPIWILALVVALVPLVALFARVELRRPRSAVAAPSALRAAAAALLVAIGMAFLARKGFVHQGLPMDLPAVGVGLVAGGWGLLRRA